MSNEIVIPYCPHPKQQIVHDDSHRFKVIVAGRRLGKTILAINELQNWNFTFMPHNYWYVAPTYKQAKLIAWEVLKYYAVPEIRAKPPNESELSIQYINGGSIRLFGADKPDSLRGVGIGGCALDEFADMKRNVWGQIIRPMLADVKGKALFIGTPKGKLNQLYEVYIKDKNFQDDNYISMDGVKVEPDPDFKSYHFKTADNPHIAPEEIENARRTLAPQYFRQEWEASFEDYTGIIYKEFTDKNIVEFEVKPNWRIYIGQDTGRHMATVFVAVDEVGRAFVFDEVCQYDYTVEQIAMLIKNKLFDYKIELGRTRKVIDSASQVKREFEKQGLYFEDSHKDVDNSISHIRTRFHNGSLFIHPRCKQTIVEHKGYVWSDKLVGVNKRPTPVKENDHTCFKAETKIKTPKGDIEIQNIKVGDMVCTPIGTCKVKNTFKRKSLVKDYTIGGIKITSTPNHKVYVNNKGFCPINTLQYYDKVLICKTTPLSFKIKGIIGTAIIIVRLAALVGYIGTFGFYIMGRYLRVMKSTIKILIEKITELKTWKCLKKAYIESFMWKKIIKTLFSEKNKENTCKGLDPWRKKHITQKNTEKKEDYYQKYNGQQLPIMNTNALCVGKHSRLEARYANIVRKIVSKLLDGKEAWTIFQQNVLFVVGNLLKINIQRAKPVLGHVGANSSGKQYEAEVFNIEVELAGCYFANGILVSNCNALQYVLNTTVLSKGKDLRKEKFRKTLHYLNVKENKSNITRLS